MKKTVPCILSALLFLAFAWGQEAKPTPAAPNVDEVLKTDLEKVSYGVGYNMGKGWKQRNLEIDTKAVAKGLEDAMKGANPLITEDEMVKVMNSYADAKFKEAKDKNAKAGEDFRAEFKKKDGVVETASGLLYRVITEGSGDHPTEDDKVVVHYKGSTTDGQEFDSSYTRGEPVTFPITGVIAGWTEALKLMRPGAKWEVVIPPALAYGEQGAGGVIGPSSTLVFQVELLELKKGEGKAPEKAEPAKTEPAATTAGAGQEAPKK